MRGSPEERFWAKVDKTDSCWLWVGAKHPDGYGQFCRGRRIEGKVGAHVVSWELVHGPVPAGKELDHWKTCPKRCVNPAHLRAVPRKQNQENRAGPNRNSTSGFRGVSFRKDLNKWRAHITHHGEFIHGGYFNTIEEANEAAIALREKWFTQWSTTNPTQEGENKSWS